MTIKDLEKEYEELDDYFEDKLSDADYGKLLDLLELQREIMTTKYLNEED